MHPVSILRSVHPLEYQAIEILTIDHFPVFDFFVPPVFFAHF